MTSVKLPTEADSVLLTKFKDISRTFNEKLITKIWEFQILIVKLGYFLHTLWHVLIGYLEKYEKRIPDLSTKLSESC